MSEIDVELLGRYPEFVAWRSQTKASEVEEEPRAQESPEELISSMAAFGFLREPSRRTPEIPVFTAC